MHISSSSRQQEPKDIGRYFFPSQNFQVQPEQPQNILPGVPISSIGLEETSDNEVIVN